MWRRRRCQTRRGGGKSLGCGSSPLLLLLFLLFLLCGFEDVEVDVDVDLAERWLRSGIGLDVFRPFSKGELWIGL